MASVKNKIPKLNTRDRLFASYVVLTNDIEEAFVLLNPRAVKSRAKEYGTLRFERAGIREECGRLRAIQAHSRGATGPMDVAQMDQQIMRSQLEIMHAPDATAADKKSAGATYAQLRKVLGENHRVPEEEDGALESFIRELKSNRQSTSDDRP